MLSTQNENKDSRSGKVHEKTPVNILNTTTLTSQLSKNSWSAPALNINTAETVRMSTITLTHPKRIFKQ